MIHSGQKAVAAAGTAVQVGTDEGERLYYFRADPDNTGSIAIGGSDVDMANGLILDQADPPIMVVCSLSELYVDADTNDDTLCWMMVL
jgi:hypothetical protein